MLRNFIALLVFSAALFGVSCKVMPTAEPAGDSPSAAVFRIWSEEVNSIGQSGFPGWRAYLIRMNGPRDANYRKNKAVESDYYSRGRIYFLNVQPGRYAMVAYETQFQNENSANKHILLDQESARRLTFEVREGEIYLGGRAVTKEQMSGPDDLSRHYKDVLFPEKDWSASWNLFRSDGSPVFGATLRNLERDEEILAEMREGVENDWRETSWEPFAP